MKIISKAVVYYRDMPESLLNYIASDSDMSFVKDGIYHCEQIGRKAPRMTIIIKKTKDKHPLLDKKRIDDLYQELINLEKNNQIICFNFI